MTPSEPTTLDEGDDERDDTQEMDDADVEGDGGEAADAADITEEIDDGNGDGEGAIEEGETEIPSQEVLPGPTFHPFMSPFLCMEDYKNFPIPGSEHVF